MAAGSAQLLADMMSGDAPAIDPAPFALRGLPLDERASGTLDGPVFLNDCAITVHYHDGFIMCPQTPWASRLSF
jgi:hypothetical protein